MNAGILANDCVKKFQANVCDVCLLVIVSVFEEMKMINERVLSFD